MMKVLTLTIKGLSKSKCEDVISCKLYKISQVDVFLFALADGAGSAQNSYEGALFLTHTFTKILKNFLKKEKYLVLRPDISNMQLKNLIWKALKESRDRLLIKAYKENKMFTSFASTFIGGMCINSVYIRRLFYVSIGDSALFTFQKVGNTIKLNHSNIPVKGEYANTTVFLTSDIWEKVTILREVDNFDYLFISSDGLDKIFFRTRAIEEINDECPIYMRYLWKFEIQSNIVNLLNKFEAGEIQEENLKNFLLNDEIMRYNSDDKSLILVILN